MGPVEKKLKQYSMLFESELTGFCAFLGGLIAQEVIKVTGKFRPIDQWIHHYDASLLGPELTLAKNYQNKRYFYQASIIGEKHMEAVKSQNIFLVGVGALGCEYVKGIALMGGSTAPGAKCIITDMDRIEVSNLSRQFLFRQADVGNPKSTSAARVVKGWNPELNIEALEKGVGDTSEDFFDDAFWESKSLCWNALDNVKARKFTDSCCLWYGLPLLESGTLGTKTNSDVFMPKLTRSYNDATEDDSNETQIAMCTLRSFPYLPLHCIEFAKQSYFSDYMEFAPQQYEAFRQDREGFFEQLDGIDSDAEKMKALSMIKDFIEIQKDGKVNFNTCVKQAFKHYVKDFITSVKDLIHQCDEMEKSKGVPFWTGTKRKPTPAPWTSQKPEEVALEYLYACANCYAFMFKVPYVRNRSEFEAAVIALNLQLPEWTPPGTGGDLEDEEATPQVDPEAIFNVKGELYKVDAASLQVMEAHDFEKDDDSNFHIDFLTVGTNLRAANYDIKKSERSTVKVTAGKIIPALATTTAMVCGLVDNEFLKLSMGLHKGENAVDQFYNCNINLATGKEAINAFRPDPPLKKETKLTIMTEYTTWDKVQIDEGSISVEGVVQAVEKKYGCTVDRLFPSANDKDAIFDSGDVKKLQWTIDFKEGALVIEPQEVFTAWPQLRMAAQMIGKLPEGAARKNFENQVATAQKSLQGVKDNFTAKYKGKLEDAYVALARPQDAEKQKYFDAVHGKRKYIALRAYVKNSAGEEASLPIIKYTFRK